ncbi:hypothetical protein L211DRAFT_4819 [Terfezia boudieri ATCC MYA-4762]|uniref:Uncharacterized protein n=1 Tax=Terfezia boudieri ATCC MYA-4762 TaxID=1051890 RepID=A0A3N4M9Z6_9PEZI|nr:hypothetical protein L211DRAFT_4819 [Terfezia boudieri ATCC MYA-4762]
MNIPSTRLGHSKFEGHPWSPVHRWAFHGLHLRLPKPNPIKAACVGQKGGERDYFLDKAQLT